MTVCRLFPLAALLVAAGLVLAQPPAKKGNPAPKKDAPAAKEPPKPAPGSLEDTLEKALRNSADIKAAEAKVRNAEAELNQVRQQVLTKATALHVDLNLAKRMLAVAEQTLAAQERAVQSGAIPRADALAMVEKHRGEVEKLETELKSLRGEFALRGHNALGVKSVAFDPEGRFLWAGTGDGTVRVWDTVTGEMVDRPPVRAAVQTPMVERVRKLLDQEVDLDGDIPVPLVLRAALEMAKSDIPLRELWAAPPTTTVAMKGKLPVGAWIQAIEDTDPDVRIVVRDYGLLATTRDRAPEGAPRAQDVWKGNYAPPKKVAEPKGK